MGYVELIKVTPDQLDTCDQCGQQGLITSGKFIEHNQENVMWICFNCKGKG
jgi:DnaJ-class molecular chaperone